MAHQHHSPVLSTSQFLAIDTRRNVLCTHISNTGAAVFSVPLPRSQLHSYSGGGERRYWLRLLGVVGWKDPLYVFCSLCPEQPFGAGTAPLCGATTGNLDTVISPFLPIHPISSLPTIFTISISRQDAVPFTSPPGLVLFLEILSGRIPPV